MEEEIDTGIKYRVVTTPDLEAQTIEQRVDIYDNGKLMDQIHAEMIKLREQGIREGLIKLGWTPPEEKQWKASSTGEYWREYECLDCGKKVTAYETVNIEDYRCIGADEQIVKKTKGEE